MEMLQKQINGQMMDVIPIHIVSCNESWDDYLLETGDVLRVRRVMKKIYQIVDQKAQDGNNVYIYFSADVSDVDSATERKD
mgnify:CR=1 FL=1